MCHIVQVCAHKRLIYAKDSQMGNCNAFAIPELMQPP